VSDETASVAPAPRRRLLAAAALYFLIVFGAGLLMGPVRVLWLEPVLGPFFAVLCETPLLVLAMWIGAGVASRTLRFDGGVGDCLALGLIALLFQLTADAAVGLGLRGLVLRDQLAYFATPAGGLYLFALVLFALMPAVRRLRTPK
jgi:hypothetical protein